MKGITEGIGDTENPNITKKKAIYYFKDVGPSTKDTNDNLIELYTDILEYRNGKTFYELLEEANDPYLFLKAKKSKDVD